MSKELHIKTDDEVLNDFYQLRDNSACIRCQYQKDNVCTNHNECIWGKIENRIRHADFIEDEYAKSFAENNKLRQALEIIIKKGVFVHLLKETQDVEEYNKLMIICFSNMARTNYVETVQKFCLSQKEYDLLKETIRWLNN